jgi:hypothetical protein
MPSQEWLRDFCERPRVRKLSFFGYFGPDSDSDVLVELKPEASVGLELRATESAGPYIRSNAQSKWVRLAPTRCVALGSLAA